MIYLEMNHVRKSFGDLEVLKDISLKVEEGEVLSIIGPSGSGKSTLLRCAAMLETMDGGDLAYLGKQAVTMENGKSVYAKPAVLRKIQENFGMVFQSFHLFPHYNVMKNLCDAPIHVQKRNRAEVEAQAEELLGKMGLTEIGSKREKTLVDYYFVNYPQVFDGEEHGGYYTQEQIKEVVAYAASKYINVIPEIEMPGHALAALASYPELSCDSTQTYKVSPTWGVFEQRPTDERHHETTHHCFYHLHPLDLPGRYLGNELPVDAGTELEIRLFLCLGTDDCRCRIGIYLSEIQEMELIPEI